MVRTERDIADVPSSLEDAVEVIGGSLGAGLVLLCDHASNAIPDGYGGLGLDPTEIERHIAYDIGAEGVTRSMAERLGVPAVLSRFSRLLIDPNRGPDDPTLVMRLSDGAIIPGNRHLDAAQIKQRIDGYYYPYHRAISQVVDMAIARGRPPVLLSLHSFTDNWRGQERHWHAGVLWDRDPRLAGRLLAAFREFPMLVVGDNQPYSGQLRGDTLWQHAMMRGLASAIVEIRQDLIREADGQQHWAELAAGMMAGFLDDPDAVADLCRIASYRDSEDEALAAYLSRSLADAAQ